MKAKESRKDQVMELPRAVLIKRGAVKETGDICKRFHISGKGVIVCDPITEKIAGLKVQNSLLQHDYEVKIIQIKGATDQSVKILKKEVQTEDSYFLLGVGGGRPIDVAKYVAWEQDCDFISIPTAASHDGIASSRASIEMNGLKTSMRAKAPLIVIGDTEIIANSPTKLLISGCADIIANYTAVLDWKLAYRLKREVFSEYAAALSEMTAKLILENASLIKPHLEASARIVLKALVSSSVAMSIAGSSRPASGSEHMFSHALDTIVKPSPLHGNACGVGTIMMMYLHGGDWKFIQNALSALGAPIDAKSLGVNDEDVIKALLMAHKIRPERYTILGNGLTEEAAYNLAKITQVIP